MMNRSSIFKYCNFIIMVLVVTLISHSNAQSMTFQPAKASNGSVLCAVDSPSHSVSVDDILGIPPGVPDTVRCSYHCTGSQPCQGFNYLMDCRQCQFYAQPPALCECRQHCAYYEVPRATSACPVFTAADTTLLTSTYSLATTTQPPSVGAAWTPPIQTSTTSTRSCAASAIVNATENCSFPFTYHGQLYYQCAVNATCETDIGCYMNNYIWATCTPDSQGFIAQNVTTKVPIPPASSVPLSTVNNWITILSRIDGTFPLQKSWKEYEDGFGDTTSSNFWLGLQDIYQLTRGSTKYKIRFELQETTTNKWYSEEYSVFSLGDERSSYSLQTSTSGTGDAGDGINENYNINGCPFAARDRDTTALNCASRCEGGWWYRTSNKDLCSSSRLMGAPVTVDGRYISGFRWMPGGQTPNTLQKCRMFIKANA